MRFISERIIAEYCPSDLLSVRVPFRKWFFIHLLQTREIIHPMAAHRVEEPFFVHKLVDKTKKEYVTALDLHDHSTYFPYAKSTGDIMLARYISNFNDINLWVLLLQTGTDKFGFSAQKSVVKYYVPFRVRLFTGYESGEWTELCSRLIIVPVLLRESKTENERNGELFLRESTVTVIDLVKPERTIAYYDSPIPVNTIDWIWWVVAFST